MGTCLGTFRTHSDIMGSKCLSRTKSQGFIDNPSPVSRVPRSHTVPTAGFMTQERGSPVRVAIHVCGDTHMCLYFQCSSLSSSSLKTSLRFSCVPPHTISLTAPHHCWPHQVMRLSVHTAPSLAVPSREEEPGRGCSGNHGIYFPSPHLNMTFSVKRLALPSHAFSAFIFNSHFSGKFFCFGFGLVWFS